MPPRASPKSLPTHIKHKRAKPSPLRQLRIARRKTLALLAGEIGCGKSNVSLWENGKREPHRDQRPGYAKALGITVSELGRLIYEFSGGVA